MNLKIIISIVMLLSMFRCTAWRTADKAIPVNNDGKYTIKIAPQCLTVNPAIGGRIMSLKLNGKDFLTGRKVNNIYWGSTLWPSPQSKWHGRRSPEIDYKPYTATINNKVIKMVSQKDPKTGLVVTKAFSGNKTDNFFTLKYTITNRSDSARKVAPWEVTRVRTNGLAFFPMGKGKPTGGLVPLTMEKDGIIWFIYKKNKIPENNRKLYADGSEGWAAEVNGRYILVKQFPDVPIKKIAPNEGEVEFYASPVKSGKSYVEMETQGAYKKLSAGASLTWQVKWYARKLPHAIRLEVGNTALVRYVQHLIKYD